MANKVNIIEINGQRYHADSGKLVDGAQNHQMHTNQVKQQPAKTVVLAMPKTATIPAAVTVKQSMPQPKNVQRSAAKPLTKHSQEPSQTLMRHAVKKPADALKRHTKAHSPTDVALAKSQQPTAPVSASQTLNAHRLHRAAATPKSEAIKRFRPYGQHTSQVKFASEPLPKPVHHQSQPAKPASPTAMFEQAIYSATSHIQPRVKLERGRTLHFVPKKVLRVGSVSLAVLLLGGFLGYQNLASLSLHQASGKAGFAATLPKYRPSGFSLGRLNYSPGSVGINFKSNSDQRSFAINEKPSDWDNQTLQNNVVASAGTNYQTVQTTNHVVYIYGSTATWLGNGIIYSVTNHNDALSQTQLGELANSL